MDPLATPRSFALQQGKENALPEEHPGGRVRDGNAHAHRPPAGLAGDRHQAAHPLHDLVHPRPVAVRPVLPESRDAGEDDAPVHGRERFVADAEALLDVGTEVLHHDVRAGDQLHEDRAPLRPLEVERQATLVAMKVLFVRAVAGAGDRWHAVARRGLDLDHVGAPIREQSDGGGAGPGDGEVEDAQAGEWEGFAHGRLSCVMHRTVRRANELRRHRAQTGRACHLTPPFLRESALIPRSLIICCEMQHCPRGGLMRTRTKVLLGVSAGTIAVLAVLGFAAWWFIFRDDAPPKVSLAGALDSITATAAPGNGSSSGSTPSASATGASPAAASGDLSGTWLPDTSQNGFLGYRVVEQLVRIGANTAVGRTSAVTGQVVIAGNTVNSATITADMTKLKSDNDQRDGQLRNQAIQTSRFPTSTFVLSSPIALPDGLAQGQAVDVALNGKLTLHGVTKDV